ncbi:MAG: phosphotransferase [Halobacteriovoraceae bacterium]|nr:phosphotransferase [Halobacteriovoraceae bacterium]
MRQEQTTILFIQELYEGSVSSGKISQAQLKKVYKLSGDASTRSYFRIKTDNQYYVACLDNPVDGDTDHYPFLKIQKFLEKQGISVPRIYDYDLKKGYLLEQDLGDITLLKKLALVENSQEEKGLYTEVLDLLIKMHQIPKDDANTVLSKSFDRYNLEFEIDFSISYFLKHYLNIESSSLLTKVKKLFEPIIAKLISKPFIFTHRDFHSRNIMCVDKELILIDFQDARWGLPQYDLVSLLEDCYYSIESRNRNQLIRYYWENMQGFLPGQENFEEFIELYKAMAIQRIFKAIGSFSYIYHHRKDIRYLKYIGYAMENLKKHLLYNDEYSELRKTLLNLYYEN